MYNDEGKEKFEEREGKEKRRKEVLCTNVWSTTMFRSKKCTFLYLLNNCAQPVCVIKKFTG
jgi:hypothetical protein